MSKTVEILINGFSAPDAGCIHVLIACTREFDIYPNKDQIWASILLLSNGRLEEVKELLTYAKGDWRDVVIAAGLAVDRWDLEALKRIGKE